MSKLFYPTLAVNNIKKNSKTYIPYILTCIGTIAMYYIMLSLSKNKGLDNINGSQALKLLLSYGMIVLAIFSAVFLFYTHSFLIKRRKKEFGLYNILGMEKRHIFQIMFWETLLVAGISLIIGIVSGILFSKLFYLLLLKILNYDVQMGFELSPSSIQSSLLLFGIIFLLSYLNTLRQIHVSKPIELLKGGELGEKEPKTKWLLTILGSICLIIGYAIALTTESPLDAIPLFFLAVLLVVLGTYCLFVAGSIALLKLLRKNKKFYYKTNHFISVSSMIYRMKQNAVGLANICILSTAVLVMLSTTVSLYNGMDDVLRNRYPRNIAANLYNISDKEAEKFDQIIEREAKKFQITASNVIRHRFMLFACIQNGNKLLPSKDTYTTSGISSVYCIPLSFYNEMTGNSRSLDEDEIFLYTAKGHIDGTALSFNDMQFHIKERIDDIQTVDDQLAALVNTYYIVVPNKETIDKIYSKFYQEPPQELSYYYGFDTDCDSNLQKEFTKAMQLIRSDNNYEGYVECVEEARESFFSLYGGLFFIGIFLGTLFIMATVLIIYYKQISEGFDDKERFEIMQKVGMGRREIKSSIRSQVLTMFFLPLITACIHVGFAFPIIIKLLALLNLTNVTLFIWSLLGTIFVFTILYSIVYLLTAKVYYKIVS